MLPIGKDFLWLRWLNIVGLTAMSSVNQYLHTKNIQRTIQELAPILERLETIITHQVSYHNIFCALLGLLLIVF
jgi:hypothetical protein